ncbi:MAG: DUF192 domain-containing protein [Alcaligenaceae bacterium]|nr:DUF192 domain-containing protein [Alcaligenaceae bacterium]
MRNVLMLVKQRGFRAALLLCAACLVGYTTQSVGQIAQAPGPLAIKQLAAGMHLIQAEVASTEASRSRGLMFRKELSPNHGMLFVFEQPSVQCFWMRNTFLALSIAFVLDDGTITNIADMAPLTENSHCSSVPVRYTLEMEQGWFAKRGVSAGKKITGLQ